MVVNGVGSTRPPACLPARLASEQRPLLVCSLMGMAIIM